MKKLSMEKQSGLVIIDMQEGILKLKHPVYNEKKLIENINILIGRRIIM